MSLLLTGKQPAMFLKQFTKQYIQENNLTGYYIGIIFVGNDEGSHTYVRMKKKYGEELGINVRIFGQEDHPLTSTQEILTRIDRCNEDEYCIGIIVQLPLPNRCKKDQATILTRVTPHKDIDGLGGVVFGLATAGCFEFYPATVAAVIYLLKRYILTGKLKITNGKIHLNQQQDERKETITYDMFMSEMFLPSKFLQGISVAIIGQSNLVGKPLAIACMNLGATVFCANGRSDPEYVKQITKQANIIISCTGVVHLIDETYVKNDKSQVVIDVGWGKKSIILDTKQKAKPETNTSISTKNTIISGDVNYEAIKNYVAALTPVPGGIGPMTIASLFYNVSVLYTQREILTNKYLY